MLKADTIAVLRERDRPTRVKRETQELIRELLEPRAQELKDGFRLCERGYVLGPTKLLRRNVTEQT